MALAATSVAWAMIAGAWTIATAGVACGADDDPFADLIPQPAAPAAAPAKPRYVDWTLKGELFSQITASHEGGEEGDVASRQSVGGELYARFSSRTAKIATLDVQARLVRRDDPIDVIDDPQATEHEGWSVELHNCYLDVYDVFNPVLGDDALSGSLGRFNLRVGKFYVPFGINVQTDTHGTVLQLSNDQDFGFERDWYVGLWGSATEDFDYDIAYLLGSGMDPRFDGQHGLVSARLSLANRWRIEHGLEGGLSLIDGERIAMSMDDDRTIVRTFRVGPDARWTFTVPNGTVALTGEGAIGEDDDARVAMALAQADYLYRSRRWGLALQYRRYENEATGTLASVFAEGTWYFRNEVGGSFLHWIKLDIERQVERTDAAKDTRLIAQYYCYW